MRCVQAITFMLALIAGGLFFSSDADAHPNHHAHTEMSVEKVDGEMHSNHGTSSTIKRHDHDNLHENHHQSGGFACEFGCCASACASCCMAISQAPISSWVIYTLILDSSRTFYSEPTGSLTLPDVPPPRV